MRLFVRLDEPAQVAGSEPLLGSASWVMIDSGGEVRSQGSGAVGPLAELAGSPALADPDRTVLLIPAEHCLAVQIDVPGTRAGQIRRALPFAVEEFLAGDLEDTHIATGPIVRGRGIAVVAIDRGLLTNWLAAVRALGLNPGVAVADASLLLHGNGNGNVDAIRVMFDGDRAMLATRGHALAMDAENLPAALASAVEMRTDEVEIEFINGTLTDIEKAEIAQATAARLTFTAAETEVPTLQSLAARFTPGGVLVNVLSGSFAPPRPRNLAWQRWRGVAALLAVWVGVGLIGATARGFWADYQADTLGAESEALYRSYFPDDKRVQNVYRQTAARLGADTGTGIGFVSMLGELTRAVTAASGTEVRSLAFNGDRTELNAELAVAGFDRLDGIKGALAGWNVEISSAEQQGNQVYARLRMRGTP